MRYYYNPLVADVYGSGPYGCDSYNTNNTSNCTTSGGGSTGGGAGTGSGGALTNTGIAVLAVVSVACAVICIALLVRFWRRGHKTEAAAEPVPVEDDDQADQPTDESDDNKQ
jgi:hypothetical protein